MSQRVRTGLLGLVVLVGAGCGEDPPTAPENTGPRIQVVNSLTGITGGSDLQLFVDNQLLINDISAGRSSAFIAMPAGSTTLQLRSKSGGLINSNFVLPAAVSELYAITITGTVSAGSSQTSTSIMPVTVADTGQPVAGRANIRVVNLPAGLGGVAVDLYVTAPDAPLTGLAPTWQMIAAGPMYTGLKDFAPDQPLQVRVTLQGTTTVLASSPTLTLGADQNRIITITHRPGGQFDFAIAID